MSIEYAVDKSKKSPLCYWCRLIAYCPIKRLARVLINDEVCFLYTGNIHGTASFETQNKNTSRGGGND